MFGKLRNIITNAVDSVGPNIGLPTGGTHNDSAQSTSSPNSSASTPTGGCNFSSNANFFFSAAAARSSLPFVRPSQSNPSLSSDSRHSNQQDQGPPPKFRYTRPHFLQLNTDDEIQVSADHQIRPIIVPRDISRMPWNSGYAETINAGKSLRNEDQACIYRGTLRTIVAPDAIHRKVCDMMPSVPGYPQQYPVSNPRGQLSNDAHSSNQGPTTNRTAATNGASSASSNQNSSKTEIHTKKVESSFSNDSNHPKEDLIKNSPPLVHNDGSTSLSQDSENSGARIANLSSPSGTSQADNASKSDNGDGDKTNEMPQETSDSTHSVNKSMANLTVKPDSLPIPQSSVLSSETDPTSKEQDNPNSSAVANEEYLPKPSSQNVEESTSKPEEILSPSDLLSPSQPLPLSKLNAETPVGEDPLNALGSLPVVTNHFNGNSNDHSFEVANECFSTPPTSPKKIKPLVEESLPWTYFGIFDGHAGWGVAVAAANTLHKIIHDKLQSIADLLIAFGLPDSEYNALLDSDDAQAENSDQDQEAFSKKRSNCPTMGRCKTFNRSIFNPHALSEHEPSSSLVINQDIHLPHDNIALLFSPANDKIVTVDSLIIGALESAFWDMDHMIAEDKRVYRMTGGCTALAALFILGKLYVANAGDSRAIICRGEKVIPMSFDFTPESERERIKYLGMLRPEFLGNDFTHLEYVRRPSRKDLGKRLLYRDAYMTGWAYKQITMDDLKFPLIYGEGKRSRVLATIGVTRGFGDHELKAQSSDVDIKPFLTPQPEVRVFDLLSQNDLTDGDVLVMATDGLWDVTTNERVAQIVAKSLEQWPADQKYRYISAAQDLVMASRGKAKERGRGWKATDGKPATIDDISVYVIPLKPYRDEFLKWRAARDLVKNQL